MNMKVQVRLAQGRGPREGSVSCVRGKLWHNLPAPLSSTGIHTGPLKASQQSYGDSRAWWLAPFYSWENWVPGRFTACPKPHTVPGPASCITVAWLRGDVSGVGDRGAVSSTWVDVNKVDLKVAVPIYKPTKNVPDPWESLSFHERFLWRQGWLACCCQSLGALSSASLCELTTKTISG